MLVHRMIPNLRPMAKLTSNQFVGMTGVLQATVWLGTILVLGPAWKPVSAAIASDVLIWQRVGSNRPSLHHQGPLSAAGYLQRLLALDFVQWAGAPLDEATGNELCRHVKLSPAFGTTECGPYFVRICDDPTHWQYYWFQEGQGIEFEAISEGLYELIFRKSETATWQQIFLLHPAMNLYRTKDLFRKHPSKDNLWLYSGRADDYVVLANGDNLHASDGSDHHAGSACSTGSRRR